MNNFSRREILAAAGSLTAAGCTTIELNPAETAEGIDIDPSSSEWNSTYNLTDDSAKEPRETSSGHDCACGSSYEIASTVIFPERGYHEMLKEDAALFESDGTEYVIRPRYIKSESDDNDRLYGIDRSDEAGIIVYRADDVRHFLEGTLTAGEDYETLEDNPYAQPVFMADMAEGDYADLKDFCIELAEATRTDGVSEALFHIS